MIFDDDGYNDDVGIDEAPEEDGEIVGNEETSELENGALDSDSGRDEKPLEAGALDSDSGNDDDPLEIGALEPDEGLPVPLGPVDDELLVYAVYVAVPVKVSVDVDWANEVANTINSEIENVVVFILIL